MWKQWKQWQTIFSGSKITADVNSMNLKTLAPWKKSYNQPRQHIKKQRHYFADKVYIVKPMVFPVVMYGCETWTKKKAERWRIDAFELWCSKESPLALESPLECKEIKSVSPKRNQFWIFTGRTDAEVEARILWTPDVKSRLIGKDSDAGKDRRQEEKGMT